MRILGSGNQKNEEGAGWPDVILIPNVIYFIYTIFRRLIIFMISTARDLFLRTLAKSV